MFVLMDLDTGLVVKTSYNQCELWNEVFSNREKNYNVFTLSTLGNAQ